MAIYGAVPPPEDFNASTTAAAAPPAAQPTPPPQSQTPLASLNASQPEGSAIDIEAWTISALESLSVSPVARGTGTPLAINIDEQLKKATVTIDAPAVQQPPIRRPLSRRDSQKTREALLKGNEGTRQRRRWENDRLIGVPNVQPPLPSDWEVHPTYPVQVVPYDIAKFWDTGLRQHIEDKTSKLQAQRKKQQRKNGSATGLGIGEVPRDLRDQAKRTPAVKGWVRVLEEPVRNFLKERSEESDAEGDSEDEEIVFVGRKGMSAAGKGWKKARREVGSEKVDTGMVFDSLGDDESASFKRWLTHSISDYYGLESRSITTGNPERRVVYVTVKEASKRAGPRKHTILPRPLWEMC
ncbi:uv-damaged dna-binding protein [Colletotrichum karsti]|uniref:Uv-damaged dna-binding protein n=1 Tax=Colletotrichum karsti TaxID=1095194 RepID=A0A9P6HVX6_9PEZI|nr:uv-damaged dna-binding protein [Colletotrichum karsti]KAF9872423.1 uv-damaged dna-binding protein [Colletotrichum karsti]